MDAPNPSAIPTAASRTPVHIGAVGMIARDLDRLTAYYRDLLGLTVQERTPGGSDLNFLEPSPDVHHAGHMRSNRA